MSYDAVLAAIAQVAPKSKNEILVDGVYRCSVCGQPTRCTVYIFDEPREVPCICGCGEAERARAAAKAREEKIDIRKKICFRDRAMRSWVFENDDRSNPRISDAMMRYADGFDKFLQQSKGLLLFGTVGTGKTFYAAAIANRVIETGHTALMTNFARISNDLQAHYDGRNEYIADLNRYQLLVIDDLGAERKSEYMQEVVYSIVDSRYQSGLPMIITTNLSADQLKRPESVEAARIYDRLMQRCIPVEITGPSRRKRELIASFGEMKEELGL